MYFSLLWLNLFFFCHNEFIFPLWKGTIQHFWFWIPQWIPYLLYQTQGMPYAVQKPWATSIRINVLTWRKYSLLWSDISWTIEGDQWTQPEMCSYKRTLLHNCFPTSVPKFWAILGSSFFLFCMVVCFMSYCV